MGDGPNPKAKWSKYKVEDGTSAASTVRTADLLSSPRTTTANCVVAATRKWLSDSTSTLFNVFERAVFPRTVVVQHQRTSAHRDATATRWLSGGLHLPGESQPLLASLRYASLLPTNRTLRIEPVHRGVRA